MLRMTHSDSGTMHTHLQLVLEAKSGVLAWNHASNKAPNTAPEPYPMTEASPKKLRSFVLSSSSSALHGPELAASSPLCFLPFASSADMHSRIRNGAPAVKAYSQKNGATVSRCSCKVVRRGGTALSWRAHLCWPKSRSRQLCYLRVPCPVPAVGLSSSACPYQPCSLRLQSLTRYTGKLTASDCNRPTRQEACPKKKTFASGSPTT